MNGPPILDKSVVRRLHGAGMEMCLANPDTLEMQFADAFDRTKLMRCILGLFEGVVTRSSLLLP